MNYQYILLYILLFPIAALSQDFSVDHAVKNYYYDPGTTTSIPITILNNSTTNGNYDISISEPTTKIEIFNTSQTLFLEPQQKRIFIIPLKIAKNCPAGEYELTIKVIDKEKMFQKNIVLKININKIEKIVITPDKNEDYVKAGDSIYSYFTVKNRGNQAQVLNLSSSQGKINSNNTITLQPSEETRIVVQKSTNPSESQLNYQLIDLHIHKDSDRKEKISAYSSINIIPINPVSLDPYKRLPIRAALSYINSERQNKSQMGWQGEIFVLGNLNDKKNDLLELNIVTKNPIEYNLYGQFEQYYGRYSNDKIYIHIGDKSYSSSVLTEYYRYGRGAEINYNFGKFSLGGFYNKPRFYQNIKDEFNFNSTLNISKKDQITLGYTQKNMVRDSTMIPGSIEGILNLPYLIYKNDFIKNTNIEAEYAYSISPGFRGSGYRLQVVTTMMKKLSANVNYIYASPSFYGYFQNTTNINASINYRLSNKVNLLTNHFQDARHIQRDTLLLTAPLHRHSQLGMSYWYSKLGSVNLFSGFMYNEDRMNKHLFKYNELFLRLNIKQTIGLFNIDFATQYGHTKNKITFTEGKSNFHQLNINYTTFNTSLNVFGNLSNTSRYGDKNEKYIYYGGRISKNITRKTAVNLFYQNNFNPEDYFKDRNHFEGAIVQKFNNNHAIELNGRYMIQRGQLANKDFIFSLKYVAQINLPLKRIADYSSLEGTITSQSESPLAGIKVFMGSNVAITDKNGHYIFKNITPGTYYLEIDNSSLPLNAITDVKLPLAVHLTGNNTTKQDFNIINSASIKGSVQILGNNQIQPSIMDQTNSKTSIIIIEASDGNQTLQKSCKINESFDFTHLKPGLWRINIYSDHLNKNYRVNDSFYEIQLSADETKIFTIELELLKKEIYYQQESIKVSKINNK